MGFVSREFPHQREHNSGSVFCWTGDGITLSAIINHESTLDHVRPFDRNSELGSAVCAPALRRPELTGPASGRSVALYLEELKRFLGHWRSINHVVKLNQMNQDSRPGMATIEPKKDLVIYGGVHIQKKKTRRRSSWNDGNWGACYPSKKFTMWSKQWSLMVTVGYRWWICLLCSNNLSWFMNLPRKMLMTGGWCRHCEKPHS